MSKSIEHIEYTISFAEMKKFVTFTNSIKKISVTMNDDEKRMIVVVSWVNMLMHDWNDAPLVMRSLHVVVAQYIVINLR